MDTWKCDCWTSHSKIMGINEVYCYNSLHSCFCFPEEDFPHNFVSWLQRFATIQPQEHY